MTRHLDLDLTACLPWLSTELIEIALDVSTNGHLPLPPYGEDSPSKIHNITIFLYSYDTGRNFTITNGTASGFNNASLGDIMFQEPGSTVKHVKWMWPDCLVGDGQPTELGSARGIYNVRMTLRFVSDLTSWSLTTSRSRSAKTSGSTARTTTPSSTCPSR